MRVVVLEAEGDVEGWSYGDRDGALYWTTVQDSGDGTVVVTDREGPSNSNYSTTETER